MSVARFDTLHSARHALLEGPRFDDGTGLLFADARGGGVFRWREGGAVETVVPHRRGIGGLVLHEAGGVVITGRNVAYKPLSGAGESAPTKVLLDRDPAEHRVGFNDLTTDARGRVYVGALGVIAIEADLSDPTLPAGGLWLIELDGSTRQVADDIKISNGLALSPDGRTLYFSDTGRRVVFSFAVDPQTGSVGERSVFIECDAGIPDGLAVTEDGSVWLAHCFAGKIVRYSPRGEPVEVLHFPVPMVTSLCFGGSDQRTLFVVTGTQRHEDRDHAHVYALKASVRGIPERKARTPAA